VHDASSDESGSANGEESLRALLRSGDSRVSPFFVKLWKQRVPFPQKTLWFVLKDVAQDGGVVPAEIVEDTLSGEEALLVQREVWRQIGMSTVRRLLESKAASEAPPYPFWWVRFLSNAEPAGGTQPFPELRDLLADMLEWTGDDSERYQALHMAAASALAQMEPPDERGKQFFLAEYLAGKPVYGRTDTGIQDWYVYGGAECVLGELLTPENMGAFVRRIPTIYGDSERPLITDILKGCQYDLHVLALEHDGSLSAKGKEDN
jgi:hypothetical protein